MVEGQKRKNKIAFVQNIMDLIVDIVKIKKHEASLYLITTIKTWENMS